MAQCSQTAFEFIQGSYGPMIAVLCTEDAEKACQKNNLNFVELIRPFSQLTSEAHIRDPLNQTHPVKGWKLRFVELSAPNPSKEMVNQLLSDVVSRTLEHQKKATPWFEAFRDCFIQMVKPSDHEFIRHFLGCLFVVSSNNSDPLNAFQSLTTALDHQQPSDTIHSKWFSSSIFKYYLMIHDVIDGEQNKADGIYQSMKSFYGSNSCHMLMINSRKAEQYSPNLPDPWSQFIISTSKNNYELDHDETNFENDLNDVKEEEVVVDENYDPLIAIQKSNEKPNPVLIGPLSFDHEDTTAVQTANEHKGTDHYDGRLSPDEQGGGARQFFGGLLSQSGTGGGHHGACLTLSDHDRIRIFIHELAIRGLLPFIERTMRSLYDNIMARKGLHKSFFHATKKWFGGGKPVGQANESLVPGIIYTSDSPELYWRKLGDLAFLVQNYDLAYNCYHTAKRDFNTNHAWLYFAGALEMASISAFMADGHKQYPSHYMETSISTYVDACRQHQFATRATLFSAEAFKNKGMFAEAAFAFLKMTGEESDLLSAIFLEQAAHCFLRTQPPRVRKYAFNMILAGHRYIKAAQRKHALRCYKQSLLIYQNKSWKMAEDHINFTIGRQSFYLRLLEDALVAFKDLLVGESLQNAEQQASHLREFLFVFQQLSNQKQCSATIQTTLPVLPLPKLEANSARVIFTYSPSEAITRNDTSTQKTIVEQSLVNNSFDAVTQTIGLFSFEHTPSITPAAWEQIEVNTYERVHQCATPPGFRCYVPCLTNETNNALKPRSVMNETIGVEVMLTNELRIPLTLSSLSLLWTFLPEGEEDEEKRIANEFQEQDECVRTEIIKEFSISGDEKKPARLSVTPLRTGNLKITGIKYSLSSVTLTGPVDYIDTKNATTVNHPAVSAVSLLGRLDIVTRGPRLNSNKEERLSVMYDEDNRLNITVVKPMPRLQVSFRGFPTTLLCGELRMINVTFTNCGEGPLHQLHVTSVTANAFAFDGATRVLDKPKKDENNSKLETLRQQRRSLRIPLPGDLPLHPGETTELTMWVQGCGRNSACVEKLLFYYESAEPDPSVSYRAVRYQSTVKTDRSLEIRATAKRSKEASAEEGEDEDTEQNNELVVALEVENLTLPDAQFRTFTVLQVSCVSKNWTMKPLNDEPAGVITINQGETAMTHFKAVRRKEDSDLKISNVAFVENEIDISCPPYSEFFYRSNTWQELDHVDEGTDGTMRVGLGVVALWESSYIDAQLSKHTLRGQSQVAVITLAESISAPILKQPSLKPSVLPQINDDISTSGTPEFYVKYSIHNPGTIIHNFEEQRSCKIAVDVILHNCSPHEVKTFVEMLTTSLERANGDSTSRKEDKSQVKPAQQFAPPSPNFAGFPSPYSSSFIWLGKRSRQINMAPGETVTLTFHGRVFKSGVYNMHHCHVLAALAKPSNDDTSNSVMVSQKPSPPSLVVVRNSGQSDTNTITRLDEELFGLLLHQSDAR